MELEYLIFDYAAYRRYLAGAIEAAGFKIETKYHLEKMRILT
jgi:hypothetical protein